MAPRYTHDCPGCVFLGTHDAAGWDTDLYACPNAEEPTVLARYGERGSDYMSGIVFADGSSPLGPHLGQALRLARARGLVD